MSVYIKGMEMPQGCDDCYFCGEMGICSVLVATHINSGVVGEYRYSEFERPPFCPLIPVPDHGRLVDADALKKECQENAKRGIGLWVDYMDVSLAPTIIPSDKEDGE